MQTRRSTELRTHYLAITVVFSVTDNRILTIHNAKHVPSYFSRDTRLAISISAEMFKSFFLFQEVHNRSLEFKLLQSKGLSTTFVFSKACRPSYS